MRKLLFLCTAFLAVVPLVAASAQQPSHKIPGDCQLYLEVSHPRELVRSVLGSNLIAVGRSTNLLAAFTQEKGFQAITKIWQTIEGKLTGPASIGVRFGVAGPSVFFCGAYSGNPDLKEIAQAIASLDETFRPTDRGTQKGIRWLALGKAGILGVDKEFLYWSERPSSLREVSRLKDENSMGNQRRYLLAQKESRQADFLVLVDTEELLKDGELDEDGRKNAFEILLLKGFIDDLTHAKFGYAWGTLGDVIKLRARLVNKKPRSKSWQLLDRSHKALPSVPNQSAEFHLERDLAAFWRQRIDLVPESGRPGLAQFAQTMNIFLAGFPFSDLMEKTGRGIDIVVRESVAGDSPPDMLLPEFALVLDTTFSSREKERFMVAYQTAIGVINADAGEKRRQPMLQGSLQVDGIHILTARFLADPNTGKRETEYNFTPSLAFAKDKLILSSSSKLAADVVHALQSSNLEDQKLRQGDRLSMSGPAVARMFKLNRDNMIEARVLSEGEDEDESAAFVDAVTSLAATIRTLRINHVSLPKSTVWDLYIKTDSLDRGKK